MRNSELNVAFDKQLPAMRELSASLPGLIFKTKLNMDSIHLFCGHPSLHLLTTRSKAISASWSKSTATRIFTASAHGRKDSESDPFSLAGVGLNIGGERAFQKVSALFG